jgi:hypothetical protein
MSCTWIAALSVFFGFLLGGAGVYTLMWNMLISDYFADHIIARLKERLDGLENE